MTKPSSCNHLLFVVVAVLFYRWPHAPLSRLYSTRTILFLECIDLRKALYGELPSPRYGISRNFNPVPMTGAQICLLFFPCSGQAVRQLIEVGAVLLDAKPPARYIINSRTTLQVPGQVHTQQHSRKNAKASCCVPVARPFSLQQHIRIS